MVNRLMALALRFQDLLSHGIVRNRAELAELGQVSRVRVCQILLLTKPGAHDSRDIALPSQDRARPRSHDGTQSTRHSEPRVDWEAQMQLFRSRFAG